MGRYDRILAGQDLTGQEQNKQEPKPLTSDPSPPTDFALHPPLDDPANTEKYWEDPRPDLGGDHNIWVRVLTEAYHYLKGKGPEMEQLYYSLHGLRCGGARLVETKAGTLRMVPGEWEEARYKAMLKKYLEDYREEVKAIFFLAQCTPVEAKEIPVEVREWWERREGC